MVFDAASSVVRHRFPRMLGGKHTRELWPHHPLGGGERNGVPINDRIFGHLFRMEERIRLREVPLDVIVEVAHVMAYPIATMMSAAAPMMAVPAIVSP